MKKILLVIVGFISCLSMTAQTIEELDCRMLKIGYEKTLHLIFPVPVKYINVGNENIIGEIIPAYPSVVRLKATEKNFKDETNLSVVTEDSKYYSYCIGYKEDAKAVFREGDMFGEVSTLPVSKDKLMHIIYPEKIIYVDFGNANVKVEKAENVDNILAVKAERPFVGETNITAITEAGNFYTFNLTYAPNCEKFSFVIDKKKQKQVAILDDKERNTQQKLTIQKELENRMPTLNLKKEVDYMRFAISNIFIDNDILLFKFNLFNRSQIGYTIDFIRFYIEDAKKKKKTAVEQLEQQQLFSFNVPENIPSISTSNFTIAMPKFTIPDNKVLIIEIQEKNGGRHFYYRMKNKYIVNAEILFPNFLNR